jgi:hypothetical protein
MGCFSAGRQSSLRKPALLIAHANTVAAVSVIIIQAHINYRLSGNPYFERTSVMIFGMTTSIVAVVQSFLKVPALKAMAPKQTEPPFLISQLVVLALFVALGIFAVKRFHNERVARA